MIRKLEVCSSPGCKNIALVWLASEKRWICKVCEAILLNRPRGGPSFILKGGGWPGKELKND